MKESILRRVIERNGVAVNDIKYLNSSEKLLLMFTLKTRNDADKLINLIGKNRFKSTCAKRIPHTELWQFKLYL